MTWFVRYRWAVVAFVFLHASCAVARETVVWEGKRTIDDVVKIVGKDLLLKPGAMVRFRGGGRIDLRDGSFTATNAAFFGDGVLTNAWRICVVSGGLRLERCFLRGMKSVYPVKGQIWWCGSVMVQGSPVRIVDCKSVESSAIAVVNSKNAEVSRNVFDKCDPGLFAFQTVGGRFYKNEFFDCNGEALRANAAQETEFADNRFTDCGKGIVNFAVRRCRFSGNSFFGGSAGIELWWNAVGNLFSANLFEDVKGSAFAVLRPLDADNVFANNVVSRCGSGWSLGKQKPKARIAIRDNVILETANGIALAEGEADAPNNAFWKVKTPVLTKDGAEVHTPKTVAADPLFVDTARGDYRLRPGSPLLNAGSSGSNIGIYP